MMGKQEKELMAMFKKLSKETKNSIISHVRFSVMAESAVKKELAQQQHDFVSLPRHVVTEPAAVPIG
nr:MAG TPA: hypothetical protein [Caudoviricetes sp.]